ncbi:MAG: NAD(P) transhydrogenase, partial [Myxococcota bacterium]
RYQASRGHSAAFDVQIRPGVSLETLIGRVENIVRAHVDYQTGRIARAGVEFVHGRAAFRSPTELSIRAVTGAETIIRGKTIIIATGSTPRNPPEIPVDHEHILDSDSILSLGYLPESMTVLGAGVIASEYASIFALLGVKVTMLDRGTRPVGFLDPELSQIFRQSFEVAGGEYLPGARVASVGFDGFSSVVTTLEDGQRIASEKMLVAIGRTAAIRGLGVEDIGIATTARGLVEVGDGGQTTVKNIYAVGDVAGPPALAATAMQQGRAAIRHALGQLVSRPTDLVPVGIYTIPEMACVGLDEAAARKAHGGAIVGRAPFAEVARAHISSNEDGLLKLVASPDGKQLLGVQIVGRGATELCSVGQMALINNNDVDLFADTVFNFPTMAEAYRVAAFDIIAQRSALSDAPSSQRPASIAVA